MENFVEKVMLNIWKKIALVGGICLFLDMAFVVVNIILRAFNHPVFGSTEIVRYAALLAAAMGLAYNQFEDGNIKVTLVLDKLSQKGRDILGFIVECILTGGFVLIAYYINKSSLPGTSIEFVKSFIILIHLFKIIGSMDILCFTTTEST